MERDVVEIKKSQIFLDLCNVTLSALCKGLNKTMQGQRDVSLCSFHHIQYEIKNSFVCSAVQITWVCRYGLDFPAN